MQSEKSSDRNDPAATRHRSAFANMWRTHRVATTLSAISLFFLVGLLAVLSITDWDFARNRIASIASNKLHRDVTISGPLRAQLLSTHPYVSVEDLAIANPSWARSRNLAEVDRITLVLNLRSLFTSAPLIESLSLDDPSVSLIQDIEGRANYVFSNAEGKQEDETKDEPRSAPKWPGVQRFSMNGGELYIRDDVHELVFQGTVEAAEEHQRPEQTPFRLRGDGTLNGKKFVVRFEGSPLANLRMDRPYEFDATVTAGKTRGQARGQFAKPFDFASIETRLDIQGDNLAHLYYLTNLALPFTPPYRVAAHLKTGRRQVNVSDLDGRVGKSDIKGNVSIALNKRPKLAANLTSESLNLADLSPAFGKGVREDEGAAKDSVAPSKLPPDKLFPTYRFQFDRLRKMDADVTLHAASIQTEKVPIKELDLKITLNKSILTLDPIVFTLPQGKIAGAIKIDAREDTANDTLDLRLSNVHLEQFKGKDAAEAPLAGVMHARLQIKGVGNSVHDLFGSAHGKANVVIPSGEVRKAFAELAGINVARGLGLLLTKNDDRTTLRCGVATLDIDDGNAKLERMVVDTDTVLITGEGNIELKPEQLNIDLSGHPKKVRLLRLRTPITLSGPIRKPNVGVDAGDVSKQVGIAAILGAALTPITAALAFIDPGLAKDENCAALLAEAKEFQVQPKTKTANAKEPKADGRT